MVVYIVMALVFLIAGIGLLNVAKKVENKFAQYVCKVLSIVCIAVGAISIYLMINGELK